MTDAINQSSNTSPDVSVNHQENFSAALAELQQHPDWKETQSALLGKESYLDFRNNILSERIKLMERFLCINKEDLLVINKFINILSNISHQQINNLAAIPYIDEPVLEPGDEAQTLAQNILVIGTVGFCAKDYLWDEQLISTLRKVIHDARKEGKIPVFLSGADTRGIGDRVKKIAVQENVPIIALLTTHGLTESSDETLIVPREEIIEVANSNGRGGNWSTSSEERGIEFISLLCALLDGFLVVAGGGEVGKLEMLHGLELGVPMKYLDIPAGNLTSAAISQTTSEKERSLIQLLLATEQLHYSETDQCFVNKAEGGNGEIKMMRVPSHIEGHRFLAPPGTLARSKSRQ